MRHFIFTLSFVIASFAVYAQQEVQFTNFMFSQMSYNPGFAGSNDAICATLLNRQQWMSYGNLTDSDGDPVGLAPITSFFSINAPINSISSGIGITFLSDKIGFETNTILRLAYAFRLNLGAGKLGIGLQGGFINKTIDFSKFKPTDSDDPLLGSQNTENAMSFDLAFGLHYKIPGKLYAGLSTTQMQGLWGGQAAFPTNNIGNPEFKGHYFIYGGYFWELPMAPSITLNPNLMVKTDFTSSQFDINVLAWYNNQIWGGVTYRATDAVAILAGYKVLNTGTLLDNLTIGLSYDVTTSAMSRNTNGSFEVFLNYCFNIEIPPKPSGHGTVRYL